MMAKIEWYEEILALEPGSKVFFPFAKRLAEDGLHDKALAVLRHGLVQHPEYLEARVFLTHLLFAVGDTESAMTESQQVFARLAPYPAFWEALSLANEAIPGDMTLVMRFMAEALRTPGLTFAATLRRGLTPQGPQAVPAAETMQAEEPAAVADAPEQPADQHETAPVAAESLSAAQPECVIEPLSAPLPESLPDYRADPLDPVESEVELPVEAVYTGSTTVDALLPLDDGDQPQLPILSETVDEVAPPTAELVVENVEKVLAAAASVDEALAELVDSQNPDAVESAEGEGLDEPDITDADAEAGADADTADDKEPPLLSLKDLEDLDNTLFAAELSAEDDGAAPVDEGGEGDESELMAADLETASETASDLIDLSERSELTDLMDPAASADAADAEPLSVVAADDAEAVVAEVEALTETAVTENAEQAENTDEGNEVEPDAPESAEAPLTFLDGGLLDFADLDDTTPEMSTAADGEDASEAREQVEDSEEHESLTPETAGPETEPDVLSAGDLDVFPDVPAAVSATPAEEMTDESDDADIPDGPVRTRSMADVLAEQGDIDGALVIYEELLHKAAPDEATSLGERMEALRGQKAVEKTEPKPAPRTDKAGLRSMLENLAGRLEKRAKA